MSDDELADVRRAHEETLRQLEALRYAETIALDELAYVEEKLKAIQDARPLNRHKRIPQFIVGCAFSSGVACSTRRSSRTLEALMRAWNICAPIGSSGTRRLG